MATYEMTIAVEIPNDFGEYQVIETLVKKARDEGGRELLKKIMLDYEQKYYEKRAVQKKGSRDKEYHTLLGAIPVKRQRMKDVFKKKCIYPLDEWMGLRSYHKVTQNAEDRIVDEICEQAYRCATQSTNRELGLKRTTIANWKLLQSVGRREKNKEVAENKKQINWKKQSAPELKPEVVNPCPILGVAIDATYVRPRRKTDKKHEIKQATLYTGKRKFGRKDKRYALTQKQLVMTGVDSSVNDLFNAAMDKAVNEYGLNSKTLAMLLGDGDSWIKNFKTDYHANTKYRLDPHHAFDNIYKFTGVEKIPEDWYNDFYTKPGALINKLKEFKKQFIGKKDMENMDKLIQYFENNKKGMEPSGIPKKVKDLYPGMFRRGSGPIEPTIFEYVCQRFKRDRMMWSHEGLSNLAFLRKRKLNKSYGFKKIKISRSHYKQETVLDEIRDFVKDL